MKVPFENSGGSGIVYIWIGSEATQEEAIHTEQMGRGMFEVGGALTNHYIPIILSSLRFLYSQPIPTLLCVKALNQRTSSGWLWEEGQSMTR